MFRLLLVATTLLLSGYTQIRLDEVPGRPPIRFSRGFVVPVHVHSDGYVDLSFDALRGALEAAMTTWHVEGSSFRFERAANGQDGDTPNVDGHNVIRFETRALPPEVDPDSVLAFTSPISLTCNGILTEVDITFNAVTTSWAVRDGSRRADVQTVAVHEFGHFLGLDHSRDENAVMFPTIVERVRRDLRADDLAGVRAIYGDGLGVPCERDGDCIDDEVCGFTFTSDEGVELRCNPPLGNRGAGGACNADAGPCENGCRNGLCLNSDICSAVCRDDTDCPRNFICSPQEDEDGTYGLCVDVDLCESRPEACPAGRACVVTVHPNEPDELLRLCVDSGPGVLGSGCLRHTQCEGAICVDGQCAELCPEAGCPAGFECAARPLTVDVGRSEPIEVCVAPEPSVNCGRDDDCPAGQICGVYDDDGTATARCLPNAGSRGGVTCFSPGACASRSCQAGRCATFCLSDEDCPAGWMCREDSEDVAGRTVCAPDPTAPDMGTPAVDMGLMSVDAGAEQDGAAVEADMGILPVDGGALDAAATDASPPLIVRRTNTGSSGCDLQGRSGQAPMWLLLALLPLGLRRRRDRR